MAGVTGKKKGYLLTDWSLQHMESRYPPRTVATERKAKRCFWNSVPDLLLEGTTVSFFGTATD